MSRGHGNVERYILDMVLQRKELIPVPVLAAYYARDNSIDNTPHLQSSFRRAAAKLADSGEVDKREVNLPTRQHAKGSSGDWRWVACVSPPDMAIGDSDMMGAAYAMVLLR